MKKMIILFYLFFSQLIFVTPIRGSEKIKIAIVSLFDSGYKEIGKYSDWNKKAYAKKHGYDIYLHHGLLDKSRPAAWSKILAIQLHLKGYDWIYWSDADSLIMNDDIKLESLIDDNYNLIIAQEATKKNLNSGSFLIKNCEWSDQLLNDIYLQEQFINTYGYWEQAALNYLLKTNDALMEKTKIVHQRAMNSHISEPGGTFELGDFVIHFYAAKNKKELMKNFYNLSISLELQKITSLSQEMLYKLLNELTLMQDKTELTTKQIFWPITKLINKLNLKKCCIVGALFGDLSDHILANTSVQKLISIDADSLLNDKPLSKDQLGILRYKIEKILAIYEERSILLPLSSSQAAQTLGAHELDCVFLNREYTLETLLKDLHVWQNKVAYGGIISGKSTLNNLKTVKIFSKLKKIPFKQDEKKKIWWIVNQPKNI